MGFLYFIVPPYTQQKTPFLSFQQQQIQDQQQKNVRRFPQEFRSLEPSCQELHS